jgi:ribosomal protein S12 methylthiotransferase
VSESVGRLIAVVSLGCDKNRVDTERMLAIVRDAGYTLTNDYSFAEVIIVNTCAFIESARKEAVSTVLEMAEYKANGKCKKLIVCGCLGQKYGKEIAPLLPEVDAFLGVADYERLPQIIEGLYSAKATVLVADNLDAVENAGRILTTQPHLAYLKIADGCDNRCSYCLIPSIRGAYRSRSIESLVKETKKLVFCGVSEIILVAQDVTRYGFDLYGEYKLLDLLKRLTETDVKRIRLLYCYPELITSELLNFVSDNDKMAKYLDIPFQHSSDRILKLMNRRYDKETLSGLLNRIRSLKNYIAIRTSFIVGFPSESEEDFEDLKRFVGESGLDHVGIFTYSRERETPSDKIKGHIDKKTKNRRLSELAAIQLEAVKKRNAVMIGKTVRVTYEGVDFKHNFFIGRSEYNAPDIDMKVYFKADFADIGNDYDIKITGYRDYDLFGEKV